MLSAIERNEKSPTIRVLCQIAESLGVRVSELVGEGPAVGTEILRRGERHPLVDPASGMTRSLLSKHLVSHGLEVIWYTVPPNRASGAFPAHRSGVVEHITVVEGVLALEIGTERVTLQSGDSITYPADIVHGFRSVGRGECAFLLLIDSSRS